MVQKDNGCTNMKRMREAIDPFGAVLRHGDFVFLTDACPGCGFSAAVYQPIEAPDGDIAFEDCRLECLKESEDIFPDGGHALAWCLQYIADK